MKVDRRPLTFKQRKVFEFIEQYQRKFYRSPSMTEIADHFELSRAASFFMVDRILKRGWLQKDERGNILFINPPPLYVKKSSAA